MSKSVILSDSGKDLTVTLSQTQHPGFYYQQAANNAIVRRQLCQGLCHVSKIIIMPEDCWERSEGTVTDTNSKEQYFSFENDHFFIISWNLPIKIWRLELSDLGNFEVQIISEELFLEGLTQINWATYLCTWVATATMKVKVCSDSYQKHILYTNILQKAIFCQFSCVHRTPPSNNVGKA